jgi:hypothetical protein
MTVAAWGFFWDFYSIPLVYVSMCQYSAVSVIMTLYQNLKLGIVISLALLFLISIALAIQGLLCFHVNFRILFFYFSEESHWNFHGDYTELVDHSW